MKREPIDYDSAWEDTVMVKIIDYKKRIQELAESNNPMAMVVLAQFASYEAKKQNPEKCFNHELHRSIRKGGPYPVTLNWIQMMENLKRFNLKRFNLKKFKLSGKPGNLYARS